MTRMLALCAALAPVLAMGCVYPPIEPPPGPVAPPVAKDACGAFCELQVKLGCGSVADSPGEDGIDGTGDDVPCAQVCQDIVVDGEYAPDRACLDVAQTCAAVEACMFGAAEYGRVPPSPPEDAPQWSGGTGPAVPSERAWRRLEAPVYAVRGKKWRRNRGARR